MGQTAPVSQPTSTKLRAHRYSTRFLKTLTRMSASSFASSFTSTSPTTSASRAYSDVAHPSLQAQGTYHVPASDDGQSPRGLIPNSSLYASHRHPGLSEAGATIQGHRPGSSLHAYPASTVPNRHHETPNSRLSPARPPAFQRAHPHGLRYSTNGLPDESYPLATSSSLATSRSTSNSPLSQVSVGPNNTAGSVASDFTSASSTSNESPLGSSHFTFSVPYPYPPPAEYRNNFPSQDRRSLSDVRSPVSPYNTKDSITGLASETQDNWARHRTGRIASHHASHAQSYEQQHFVKTESADSDNGYLYQSQLLRNHTPFTQLADTMSYHGHPHALQPNPMSLSLDTLSALRTAAPDNTFDESADDYDGDEREDDQDTLSPLTSRPSGSLGYGLNASAGYGFAPSNSSGTNNNSMGNGRKAEKEKQVRRRSSKGEYCLPVKADLIFQV